MSSRSNMILSAINICKVFWEHFDQDIANVNEWIIIFNPYLSGSIDFAI